MNQNEIDEVKMAVEFLLYDRGFTHSEARAALQMFEDAHGFDGHHLVRVSDIAQEYIARDVGAGVVEWDRARKGTT